MLAQIPTLLAQLPASTQSTSLIDWWTVSAQVVNFLILVLLLRHFLYGRIVRAMDQRRKKIASHFASAEKKEQDAAAQAERLQREQDGLEQQRDSMLAQARQQAQEQRQTLIRQAREEVQTQADRWRQDIERGKKAFLQEMRDTAGRQICEIARRALADLAGAELEAAIVSKLLDRLDELSADGRAELDRACANDGQDLVVATAGELPQALRDKATQAIRKVLATDAKIRFQTAPELACGIELRAGGRSLSWTIETYVEGIQQQLDETISRTVAAESNQPQLEKAAPDTDEQAQRELSNE